MLVRWLADPKRLSHEQIRLLRAAIRRGEPLAVSAITLLEIAVRFANGPSQSKIRAQEILTAIESQDALTVLPLDIAISREVAALGGALRDPADRAIVATARVHRLRLITSDQRIIDSGLAPVIE